MNENSNNISEQLIERLRWERFKHGAKKLCDDIACSKTMLQEMTGGRVPKQKMLIRGLNNYLVNQDKLYAGIKDGVRPVEWIPIPEPTEQEN